MSSHNTSATQREEWTRSDKYFENLLIPKDNVLEATRTKTTEASIRDMAVSPAQGKFLHLLARSINAKRIVEVGTLGAYSTIWLARALPEDGKLMTFELSELHAEVARKNLEAAGLSSKATVVVGPAIDGLKRLQPSFDLAFIDADKQSNLEYFIEAKRLVRSGGVIIVDNVVRRGQVADLSITEGRVEGVRRLINALQNDSEVDCTVMGTAGCKGYDGFLYAIRN
ncbi:S-adenosyl-L-methionine-dependent methyltransferase [Fistulina hepatica ATCC 64428]|uniref:S-adenosyl-L-methionine-dependent methyltransferase n=1 Tax=Fistulina hepatica ATCC 64428 TaxID=1128425 RepID=A0A0D7A524_9AGAR|nr:S-adenosyl-L-methionine-dependent methyltransferase [Fistulina hepatica ATCC 64428]